MKTMHRAMMGVLMTAILAVALGALQPWNMVALAQHGPSGQHGQADDPQAHFDVLAERLELTARQRADLQQPFTQAFAAMQELHRLHEVVAAGLTDAQKEKLAELVHEAMAGSMMSERHSGGDHGDGRR